MVVMTPTRTAKLATTKQTDFIRTLLAERAGNEAAEAVRDALNARRPQGISAAVASDAITRLLAIKVPRRATAPEGDEPTVPAGHYATISRTGSQDLDFWRVDCPTEGRWAGRTFVKRVIGGHEDTPVRGEEARQALAAIAGDPEAGPRYGQEIGRCYRCNRTLTDQTSRDLGIGPTCREG
jgi:hypothetical protein